MDDVSQEEVKAKFRKVRGMSLHFQETTSAILTEGSHKEETIVGALMSFVGAACTSGRQRQQRSDRPGGVLRLGSVHAEWIGRH